MQPRHKVWVQILILEHQAFFLLGPSPQPRVYYLKVLESEFLVPILKDPAGEAAEEAPSLPAVL